MVYAGFAATAAGAGADFGSGDGIDEITAAGVGVGFAAITDGGAGTGAAGGGTTGAATGLAKDMAAGFAMACSSRDMRGEIGGGGGRAAAQWVQTVASLAFSVLQAGQRMLMFRLG